MAEEGYQKKAHMDHQSWVRTRFWFWTAIALIMLFPLFWLLWKADDSEPNRAEGGLAQNVRHLSETELFATTAFPDSGEDQCVCEPKSGAGHNDGNGESTVPIIPPTRSELGLRGPVAACLLRPSETWGGRFAEILRFDVHGRQTFSKTRHPLGRLGTAYAYEAGNRVVKTTIDESGGTEQTGEYSALESHVRAGVEPKRWEIRQLYDCDGNPKTETWLDRLGQPTLQIEYDYSLDNYQNWITRNDTRTNFARVSKGKARRTGKLRRIVYYKADADGLAALHFDGTSMRDWAMSIVTEDHEPTEALAEAFESIGALAIPDILAIIDSAPLSGLVQRRFIGLLDRMGWEAAPAVGVLMRFLEQDDKETNLACVKALGSIGSRADEAVPLLVRVTHEGAWQAREAAIEALGAIGKPARTAIPRLIELLVEDKGPDQCHVLRALRRMNPEPGLVVSKLAEIIDSTLLAANIRPSNDSNDVMIAAMEFLSDYGEEAESTRQTIERVVNAAEDEYVQKVAAATLRRIRNDK